MGDPACWLDAVCPDCGQLLEATAEGPACPRRCRVDGVTPDLGHGGVDVEFRDGRALRTSPPSRDPLGFHRRLPGYAVTPLVEAPSIARTLEVAEVLVKDESARLGLPSFKALGAWWATYRTVTDVLGVDATGWSDLRDLAGRLGPLGVRTLVAATEGNHGRAVARFARLLGWRSRIYVPASMSPRRRRAIVDEGAEVVVVDGTYDDAVARSADDADDRHLVISDTSWPGYDTVPSWVIEGYATIFWELDEQLRGRRQPDVVVVQMGVGALAAAAVRHFRRRDLDGPPALLGVEPSAAVCVLAAVRAGGPTTVPGPHDSVMAGLNCGRVSEVAWPPVSTGLDGYVAAGDAPVAEAMRALAAAGVESGETGAAGLAGLLALHSDLDATARARLGLTPNACVLVLSTEGATDPDAYATVIDGA